MGHLPSSDVPPAVSTIHLYPIRNLLAPVVLVHHRPGYRLSQILFTNEDVVRGEPKVTFFLNCLWIASSASLIVTPLRFRAVTSRPSGKCRSIFLTGGLVRNFLRTSFSSKVAGEVLSFLLPSVSIVLPAFVLYPPLGKFMTSSKVRPLTFESSRENNVSYTVENRIHLQ